jgi:hypothetical protein
MLKRTRILIIISALASFVSFYTVKKEWGELYPFFYYKLYSRPEGMSGSYSTIRVYIQKENGVYERVNKMPDDAIYDQDDFMYQVYDLLKDTVDAPEASNQKVKLLVQSVFPKAICFQLVEETYLVQQYFEGDTSSKKRIIMSIHDEER